MDIRHVFGESLKRARKKAGFSQEHLAEIVGVEWKHISRLECGERFTSAETLEAIIDALQVEPAQLFGQPQAEELMQVICFIECSRDAIHTTQLIQTVPLHGSDQSQLYMN